MYAATVRLKDWRSIDYDIACDTEAFARREIISQLQQDLDITEWQARDMIAAVILGRTE